MNITKYLRSGYAALFIEATEIKRCVRAITVDVPFEKLEWDFVSGLSTDNGNEELDQISILNKVTDPNVSMKAIVLENFDLFLETPAIVQTFLNNYKLCKSNSVCMVIVGNNPNKIPIILKELIPVIQFNLPTKDEVSDIVSMIAQAGKEDLELMEDYDKKKDLYNFSYTDELISACLGLSHEEMENALALSLMEYKCFNIKSILDRKRQIIKSTGFMDFMNPEPIENLGGLDKLKDYINKRKEAFKDGSIKPKLRSVLLVGVQGCGKSLSAKCMASIFDWPLIQLDIGAMKGGIVGETEKNVRLATKTIDAFGKSILLIDEVEKSLAGASGQNLDSGVSSGMLGTLLTWFQERTSEGIIVATANDLSKLPPEFLRAGRFDSIFFVDTPNAVEIGYILNIMNNKYKSELPTDAEFCKQLEEEQWTGAEIEQLAKDSHFDELEEAMNNVPLLAQFRRDDIEEIRKKAKQFRAASSKHGSIRKKLQLKKEMRDAPVAGRKLNFPLN